MTRSFADLAESFEALRQMFDYREEDGQLVWKERPEEQFSSPKFAALWNRTYVGKIAGWKTSRGYIAISIGSSQYLAHRLVWTYHNGSLPPYPAKEIDHINGNKSDNRVENLRAVDRTENTRNTGLRKDNKSGVCGVRQDPVGGRWDAAIRASGRQVYLGRFATKEEAIAARRGAEKALGYHENHGKKRDRIEATAGRGLGARRSLVSPGCI